MTETKTTVKIIITLIPYVQKAKKKINMFGIGMKDIKQIQDARGENYNN